MLKTHNPTFYTMTTDENTFVFDTRLALARNYHVVFGERCLLEVDSYRQYNGLSEDRDTVLKLFQSELFEDLGELPEISRLEDDPGSFAPEIPFTRTNCIYRVDRSPQTLGILDFRKCCPFCKLPENEMKKYYLKKERLSPIYKPLFHGEFSGGYQKHLAVYHGVYTDFVALQPFIGFAKGSSLEKAGRIQLVLVCPYMKNNNEEEPCLAVSSCEGDKRGMLLRKFFEHVFNHHDKSNIYASTEITTGGEGQRHALSDMIEGDNGIAVMSFVPLEMTQFLSTFHAWEDKLLRTIDRLGVVYDTKIFDQSQRMWTENHPGNLLMFEVSNSRYQKCRKPSSINIRPLHDPLLVIRSLLEAQGLDSLKNILDKFIDQPLQPYIGQSNHTCPSDNITLGPPGVSINAQTAEVTSDGR